MPNMAAILSRHNKTILASKNTNEHLPCNCRRKAECPPHGDYRRKAIVYKASISQIATILSNRTMDAAKRNLNLVFTTIARLSKTSKKDIPPSYRKPSGKPWTMGENLMLYGAFRPDLVPTNAVPPGAISASMKS